MRVDNFSRMVRFWHVGHGGASQVVSFLTGSCMKVAIRVGSRPFDLWAGLPIRFYERKIGLGDRLRSVPYAGLTGRSSLRDQVDWVIIQTMGARSRQVKKLRLTPGEMFILKSEYANYGPSGVDCYLYRHAVGVRPEVRDLVPNNRR
jgi:hypothetical protein